jgi:hypothetical protein
MGRAFAREFGVCGKTMCDKDLPDYELSWLRIWQHELATREADAIKARRVSRRLRLSRNRPGMSQTLIRMSNKGSAWHRRVVLLLRGDDPGLARRMARTRHNRKSTVSTLYIRRYLHRGKGRWIRRISSPKSHIAAWKSPRSRVPWPPRHGME